MLPLVARIIRVAAIESNMRAMRNRPATGGGIMITQWTRGLLFGAVLAAPMVVVGCKAPPPRSPKILGSMRPPVGMQAPPVNSKTPVLVPTAPLASARPAVPAYAVPAQPAVAVPVQPAVPVPGQPGVALPPQPASAPPVAAGPAPAASYGPPPTQRATNRTAENPANDPERLEFPPEP
jgi:hypothetical protein